jgi:hypothetical protein
MNSAIDKEGTADDADGRGCANDVFRLDPRVSATSEVLFDFQTTARSVGIPQDLKAPSLVVHVARSVGCAGPLNSSS